jgi:hypothetical protein
MKTLKTILAIIFLNSINSFGQKSTQKYNYDTINVKKILIASVKYPFEIDFIEKKIGKSNYYDIYKSVGDDDGDFSNSEYHSYLFGCNNFDDCKNSKTLYFSISYSRPQDKPLENLKLETIDVYRNSTIKLKYKSFEIGTNANILILEKAFPNSFYYYLAQKKKKTKERNIGIMVWDVKNYKKLFFGIDEKTNTISSISLDDLE